jgi:hypothetical protein
VKGAVLLARGGELRFAHGVNSRARMDAFLSSPVNVFEVDVAWGFLVQAPDEMRLVTAHPPILQSDLGFEEMFETSLAAGRIVKIDLKDRVAQEKVLEYLVRTAPSQDRYFLNADMTPGPNGQPPVFSAQDGLLWRARLGGDLLVSIGCTTDPPNGPYGIEDIDGLLAAAAEVGEPCTVCLDVHRLELHGGALDDVLAARRHVSLWNMIPADEDLFRRYRARCPDAFIDLFDADRAPVLG